MSLVIPQPSPQYDRTVATRTKQLIEAEDIRNRKKGADLELGAERLILRSPNGTRYQVIVSDGGGVSVAPAPVSGNASPSAWTAWTPTVTSRSGAITTYTVNEAKYQQSGKLVTFHIDITINTIGTAGQNLLFTLPVPATTASEQSVSGFEVGVAAVFIGGAINSPTSDASHCTTVKYDGTSIFAIGNGARPVFAGTYEAA